MKFHTIPSNNLYSTAANRLLSVLERYFSDNQSALIFFSGGSAARLYPYLVDWIKRHPIRSFQGKLALGLVDERFFGGIGGLEGREELEEIEQRDKNINAVIIGKTGLWEMCREKRIACHLISQDGTLKESSAEYNQTISGLWKSASKKIAVLGIGEDGHTAGLLPGYQKDWDVDRMVVGYENDGPFPQRISLTAKSLKSLDYALVVAQGEKKRRVLDRLQSQKRSDLSRKGQTFFDPDKFPAAILRGMKEVHVFTDQQGFTISNSSHVRT